MVGVSPRKWILVALAVVVSVVATLAVALWNSQGNETESHEAVGGEALPGLSDRNPEEPDYPDGWKASLSEARSEAPFPILLPDQPEANNSNLVEVFIRRSTNASETGVALIFPIAEQAASPVRQEYIGIFVQAWSGGDPKTEYADYLVKAKSQGYADQYTEVGGYPAIEVPAHADSDIERANPAFLTTVVRGIELQVYGGEDLARIRRIAEDLVGRYEASS